MPAPLILLARHYDRVAPIIDGRVTLRGERVRCEVAASIPESFRRMMTDPEVLAGEMSFGFHTIVASSQQNSRFVAIPIFPSRSFRHGNVFVRAGSNLTRFAELRGAKVALEEYAMTMGIWVRALLDEAGAPPETIQWFTGRDPVVVPEVEQRLRSAISMARVHGESIWALLGRGEIDAVIGRPPDYRDVDGGSFRRLLPDHWAEQRAYFAATSIFPIMHTIDVRREAYEADPQIASDIYDMFCEAKRLAIDDMSTNLNALTISLPMLEAHIAQTREIFGNDWWPYGIEGNISTIIPFIKYCHAQKLTEHVVRIEDIFCKNLLTS